MWYIYTVEHYSITKTKEIRNSLAVQWLGFCTSTAGGRGSIPGWGTKFLHACGAVSTKKETTPLATTWMDLETVILNAVSQKEKGKYHMVSLICRI